MMHAGVPIRCHVAGIAMGLIKEGDKVQILTDIQGLEDHYGDMDFKVAGTRAGVTALQMDNKAGGITREILEQALGQARRARMQILEEMESVIPVPNKLSPNAPRIITFEIDPDKIREVIGSGGKVVRSITQTANVKLEIDDNGIVTIAGATMAQVEDAHSMVMAIIRDLTAGDIYYGTVTRIMSFGGFVECLPGKEGMLHISEVSTYHLANLDDACTDALNEKTDNKKSARNAKIIGGTLGAVTTGMLGLGITKSVQKAKYDKAENAAIAEWMEEIGEHIQCYLGTEELGSYGDVVSFTIE